MTLIMMILGRFIFQRFGWTAAALVTPTVLALTGAGFFSLILFEGSFAPLLSFVGTTPLMAAVVVGAAQVTSRALHQDLFHIWINFLRSTTCQPALMGAIWYLELWHLVWVRLSYGLACTEDASNLLTTLVLFPRALCRRSCIFI